MYKYTSELRADELGTRHMASKYSDNFVEKLGQK
jgi:hypothetical protein